MLSDNYKINLKKFAPEIIAGKNESYDFDKAFKLVDEDPWITYVFCKKVLEYVYTLRELDETEEIYNEELALLDFSIEKGKMLYDAYPDLGCIILGLAYDSFPALYVYNNRTGEWEEDNNREHSNFINCNKYLKEAYEKHNNLDCAVMYARRIVIPFYSDVNPSDGIAVLNDLLQRNDCPAEAYELMAEELMMGKRVPQDVQKSLKYFDLATEKGCEFAQRRKEHFYSHFGQKKKGLFW